MQTKINFVFHWFNKASCRGLPNEEYAIDPYRCQVNCETYGDPSCPDYAPDGDCYCKNGYIRLRAGAKCIPVDSLECRFKLPPTKGVKFLRISLVTGIKENSLNFRNVYRSE